MSHRTYWAIFVSLLFLSLSLASMISTADAVTCNYYSKRCTYKCAQGAYSGGAGFYCSRMVEVCDEPNGPFPQQCNDIVSETACSYGGQCSTTGSKTVTREEAYCTTTWSTNLCSSPPCSYYVYKGECKHRAPVTTTETCSRTVGSCSDGNYCTYGETCQSGTCRGGISYSCPLNSCQEAACDGQGGCSPKRDLTSCNDNEECTIGDRCLTGYCEPRTLAADGTSCRGGAGMCLNGICTISPTRQTYYQDADGDGEGTRTPTDFEDTPSPPSGYVTNNLDCDDSNSAYNTRAVDNTCNDIDEDCDGTEQEGCPPSSGTTCTWVPPACSGSPGCTGSTEAACEAPPGNVCTFTGESCSNPPACAGRAEGSCNNGCTPSYSSTSGQCLRPDGRTSGCGSYSNEASCMASGICEWYGDYSCSGTPSCPAPSGGSCGGGCTYTGTSCTGTVDCSQVSNNAGTCAYGCTPQAGYWTNGRPETCDGLDNNCDASLTVDEGGVCNDNNNCGAYQRSCGSGYVCSGGNCVCGYSPSCSPTYQQYCIASDQWEGQSRGTACTGGCTAWQTTARGTCVVGDNCQGAGNCVDVTAPSTSISITPSAPNGLSGWRNTTTTFTLTCSDVGSSGCSTSHYCISATNSCTTWQTYPGSAVTVPDGIYYIFYYSRDNQGNQESSQGPEYVQVDTIPPSIYDSYFDGDEILGDPYTNTTYERTYGWVQALVTDDTSGILSVTATLSDNASNIIATYPIGQDEAPRYARQVQIPDNLVPGKYYFRTYVTDNAGLVSNQEVLNNYIWIGPDKLIVTLDNNGSSDVYVPFDRYGQLSLYVQNMARTKRMLTFRILDPNQDAAPYRYWVAFKGYEKSPQRYEIQQELNPFEEINVPLSLYGGEKNAQFLLTVKSSVDDTNVDEYTNATIHIADVDQETGLFSQTPESEKVVAIVAILAIGLLLIM